MKTEAVIAFLRPNIFGFKRIWITSEDTAFYPEPIKTARCSFLFFCMFGRRVLATR